MEYARWAPYYLRIAEEFGYSSAREESAAEELRRILPPGAWNDPNHQLRTLIEGRDVVVVGRGGAESAPPLSRLSRDSTPPVLLAADGATELCLGAGLVPTVILTDLDGPVPVEVASNARGSLVLVHAHGDNQPALARWVPEFPASVLGSWSGSPHAPLVNFGGFTDGDRGVYLAEALGARRIYLFGFDFERPAETAGPERAVKQAKLRWARYLIAELARCSPTPMAFLRPDGSQLVVQLPGAPGAPRGPSIQ